MNQFMSNRKNEVSTPFAIISGLIMAPLMAFFMFLYNYLLWNLCDWLGLSSNHGHDTLLSMMTSTDFFIISLFSVLMACLTVSTLFYIYLKTR